MVRRSLHILTLSLFLASASGAALSAHESLQGPNHSQQTCTICQDLLAGSNAVVPVAACLPAPAAVVEAVVVPSAQQPAMPSMPPAIAPRGPPTA